MQDERGLRRVLSLAPLYQALQNALGVRRLYDRLVADHVAPPPGARILDIGCGPAAILAALPDGVEYHGFDTSERYIAAARKRWGDRGRFWCARVDEATLADLPRVDRVLAVGVLHHLDDGEAKHLFALARAALAPGGRVVTYDPCFTDGQGRLSRALVSRDRGRNVRTPDEYVAIARTAFSRVDATVLDGHLRLPYTAVVLTSEA